MYNTRLNARLPISIKNREKKKQIILFIINSIEAATAAIVHEKITLLLPKKFIDFLCKLLNLRF